MKRVGLFLAALIVAVSSTQARASLLLTGEVETFTGPGTYSLDVLATAVGQDETIGGSNIALDFSSVGLVGTPSYVANPAFNLPAPVVPITATVFGLGGTSTAAPDLTIAAGTTAILGTVTFDATSLGELSFFSGATFQFTPGGVPITLDLGAGPTLQPVPSPTGFMGLVSLGLLGVVGAARRRRS